MSFTRLGLQIAPADSYNDLTKATIPDKIVETKCNFCNSILYVAFPLLLIRIPPFLRISVAFVALSFILQNALNIELGEGKIIF